MMFNIKIEDRFRITRKGARILSLKLSLAAIRSLISAEYNKIQVISEGGMTAFVVENHSKFVCHQLRVEFS
jgi:hypothetical protein